MWASSNVLRSRGTRGLLHAGGRHGREARQRARAPARGADSRGADCSWLLSRMPGWWVTADRVQRVLLATRRKCNSVFYFPVVKRLSAAVVFEMVFIFFAPSKRQISSSRYRLFRNILLSNLLDVWKFSFDQLPRSSAGAESEAHLRVERRASFLEGEAACSPGIPHT